MTDTQTKIMRALSSAGHQDLAAEYDLEILQAEKTTSKVNSLAGFASEVRRILGSRKSLEFMVTSISESWTSYKVQDALKL